MATAKMSQLLAMLVQNQKPIAVILTLLGHQEDCICIRHLASSELLLQFSDPQGQTNLRTP